MTVALPSHITIGPVRYAIRVVKDLHDHDKEGKWRWLHGDIRWSKAQIRIDEKQSDERKVVTLWHETLHGILEHDGHSGHDENLIIALGFGIVQVIRDNPALVAYTLAKVNDDANP